ncbi:hypothetical protein H6P81_011587 [Aristolochia fimbriata]|uniref:UV radiation resistance protein/autophagy-related protein 14 n=1 Tax=Aristolochia fimbriata TaxID=158543 RepID=A0AAV7EVI0_ARIFI|nr:hypothetical protein H6P81_011587 [Aristolochia fimbriata]
MARKSSGCAICENSNLASICAGCVNCRLNDYHMSLNSLKSIRDSLYMRLNEELIAKSKADDQLNWRALHNEKVMQLKEKLRLTEKHLSQGKSELARRSTDLKIRYGLLESSLALLERHRKEQLGKLYPNLIATQSLGHMAITSQLLHKQSVVIKQICRLFPQRRANSEERKDGFTGQYDQICNARLPRGLDPHSVPSEELAASLGYMVLLLNLVVRCLAAPTLHNTGFAGSCSRIWQRDSYWDARPSSRSDEYPLFIPRQNFCSTSGENSWSDRSSINFGVASVESERKLQLDSTIRSNSFNYSSSSPHSVESHRDLQKGISLLKKSVACITAYYYNSLCLDFPSDASTFEAFSKLLTTLSSSKEVRSGSSLKMACSRSCKQVQQCNRSVCHVNSALASSSLVESGHTTILRNTFDNNLSNSAASFIYAAEIADGGKAETLADGWDIVERPTFPPTPSQTEDIEHWTRAMFTDAKRDK